MDGKGAKRSRPDACGGTKSILRSRERSLRGRGLCDAYGYEKREASGINSQVNTCSLVVLSKQMRFKEI